MEIGHVLPRVLADSELWRYVFDVVDTIIARPLGDRVEYLTNRFNMDYIVPTSREAITAPDISGDPNAIEMVKRLAQHVGYHYDSIQDSPNALARFARESIRLSPDSGTTLSFNFIQYILNGYLEVSQLWWDPIDKNFYPVDAAEIAGRRIVTDGHTDVQDCYPTPYVTIKVEQDTGLSDLELIKLVYSVVPKNIVIWSIETIYTATIYAGEHLVGMVAQVEPSPEVEF